jgi:hypothetical protein
MLRSSASLIAVGANAESNMMLLSDMLTGALYDIRLTESTVVETRRSHQLARPPRTLARTSSPRTHGRRGSGPTLRRKVRVEPFFPSPHTTRQTRSGVSYLRGKSVPLFEQSFERHEGKCSSAQLNSAPDMFTVLNASCGSDGCSECNASLLILRSVWRRFFHYNY